MSETTNMKGEKSIGGQSTQPDTVSNFIKRQKERDSAPKGITRREFLKTMGKWGAGIALTGAIGAGAVKFLNSIGKDTGVRAIIPPKEIPPTYDPATTEAWIGPQNSIQMTLDEYEKDAPPIWNEESKTMTIPLPIKFRDGRIPNLRITKMEDGYGFRPGNDLIQIDAGLEEGDIIFSPYDGRIEALVVPSKTDILQFFICRDTDSPPEQDKISFNTRLKPLIDLSQAVKVNRSYVSVPIKKDQPIGEILTSYNGQSFNPKIQITGLSHALLQENFNLATSSEGKAIIIK